MTDRLNSGEATSLSMVSGDLDRDGVEDLAVGYGTSDGGIIAFHRGNLDAFAPQSKASFEAIGRGDFPAPFLRNAKAISIPVRPDFVAEGCFNPYGYRDLLVAARGGRSIYLLSNDGEGNFSAPKAIDVDGEITALAIGEFGKRGAFSKALVATSNEERSELNLYEGSISSLGARTLFPLEGTASMIVFGNLADNLGEDAVILSGGRVLVLNGVTRQLETISLTAPVKSVALGSFIVDRNQGLQLALLTSDGNVQFAAHSEFDPRSYSLDQLNSLRSPGRWRTEADRLMPSKSFRAQGWKIVEEIPGVARFVDGPSPIMLRTRISDHQLDDVMVLNGATSELMVIAHPDVEPGAATFIPAVISKRSYAGSPIAAIPARINVDGRPGVLAIHQGETTPFMMMPLPDPTFFPNRFDDPAVPVNAAGTPQTTSFCNNTSNTDTSSPCSLREAIIKANLTAGTDTIMLQAGTYTLSIPRAASPRYDAVTGTLNITDSVNIIGAGQNSTIIQAGTTAYNAGTPNGVDMLMAVNEDLPPAGFTNATASISNITLQNGHNRGTVAGQDGDAGCLEFDTGGSGSSTLTLTSVTIQNCDTTDGNGGGLAGFNTNNGTGLITITNGIIQGNKAVQGGGTGTGGGIWISDPSRMSMSNSQVINNLTPATNNANQAGSGGGITITSNSANSRQTLIHNSAISGNQAAGEGGGIKTSANLIVDQGSIISSNSAGSANVLNKTDGGGIFINVSSNGCPGSCTDSVTLTKVAITGNSASHGRGGGISTSNPSGAGPLSISFSRLAGNSAATSGSNLENLNSTVTATNNWWGTNAAGTTVHTAAGTTTFDPFIVLTHTANPSKIRINQSTTLTGDMSKDNHGNAAALAGNLDRIIGLPITFNNAVLGAIPQAQPETLNGSVQATATFNAGGSSGRGSANATVDQAIVPVNSNLIAAASEAGTTATITTVGAHNFAAGQSVVLTGVGIGGYNGTFIITSTPTTTSFTYTTSAGLGTSSGGSATVGIIILEPLQISKSFGPTVVPLNGPATLTFNVTNPNVIPVDASFTDSLPAGLVVANPTSPTNTCGGTFSPVSGAASFTFTNAALGIGSCSVSVKVSSAVDKVYSNSVTINSTDAGTGAQSTSSANLTVINPPHIVKAFGAPTIPLNGTTTLTFTIDSNSNQNLTQNGVAFTDTLPAGLVVASTPNLSNNCGGTATAVAGSSSVSLSGPSIGPNTQCAVSVNVQGTTAGAKNNSVQVSSTNAGVGNTSNATITVVAPPTISKSFGAASVPLNGSTTVSFTITNPNTTAAGDLTGVAFSDTLPSSTGTLVVAQTPGVSNNCGGTVTAAAGSGVISLAGGNVTHNTTCTITVNVTGTVAGNAPNTTGAITSTEGGTGMTSNTPVLKVMAPPVISKAFNPTTVSQNTPTQLTFTITNPSANTLSLTGVAFTDALTGGLQVAATPSLSVSNCGSPTTTGFTAGSTSLSVSNATVTTATPCVISVNVSDSQAGTVSNTTSNISSTEGGAGDSSNTAMLTVCASPATVTSTADSGAGTLRQALLDVCDGSTISISIPGPGPDTITLTSGELAVTKNVTIKNSSGKPLTISGNNASRVFNINVGTAANIIGLTISGGQDAGMGGGILNNGTLTIANSTLTGNNALSDGGAIATSASAVSLTLINTTISGNNSNGSGGGVVVLGGTMTSINSTITNNKADNDNNATGTGGGVAASAGTTTLKNTIVAGNFNEDGATDAADDISGTVDAASSFNLIGTGGAGGLTNGVNNNQVNVAGPGLGALADNGGPTQTHALLPASPAIEAGGNANLPADAFDLDGDGNTAETLPTDQRGVLFPRVADSADVNVTQTVDIGAYEAHPTIEDIFNQSTNEDTVKNVSFNLGDDTGTLITGAGGSVTATSSNVTLVPNANLLITGSGGLRNLQITPASGQSGTTTITVTVTATNGRTATDTFDLTVNSVNDPPAGTDNTVTTNEDTAYTFTAADFGFTDPNDSPPNALLAVKITTLPALGTLTNNNVPVNAGDFVPATDITGGLLKFTPVANANGTPYTSFTFQVQDDGGGTDLDPTPNTMTINVTAVNDAPSFTIAADPPPVLQDAGPQTVNNFATNISAGAPNESGQVLTFNVSPTGTTGTLTFSTAPAIDATTGTLTYTPANGTNGTASFSVTLSDNGSNTPPNSNTSGAQSFTITVFAPNATPVVTTTAGNLAYTENDPAMVIDSGVTVMDSDSANLTGATVSITAGFVSAQDTLAFTNQLGITGNYNSGSGVLTLSGTTSVANYQTALRSVTYQNGSDNPTASRTITFSATDGFTIGSAMRGIAITAVNDAPVNTVPGSQSTNEDTAKVFSSGNGNQISVADVDLGAGTIKITLTATNGTLTLSTTAGLSFVTGDGTDDATMTFTGTLANVNTALNGIAFNPTANFNGAASLQIVSDDQGNTGIGGPLTDTDNVNITVNGVNDAPVVTTTAGSLAYTENDTAKAIDPGLTVTDIDSANLTGATVAVTGNFAPGEDVLAFMNQPGITGSYSSGTGVLTLTGTTTVANYQTALRSVTYTNSSDNPSTATRTVTFTANDGSSTGFATRGIALTAVNDPPVNTVPGTQGTPQNTPLVFSSGNSNQISVADSDAGANAIQVTLTATNGTLTLSGASGLAFTVGDGTADGTMTFTGTLANVNAALNGMTFTPAAGFSGAASVNIVSNDLGHTGTGGPLTDNDTVNIQVGVSNVSIADSHLTEPASGSANMVFTVTLSVPAPAGGASVHFATQDQAPALNHATAGQDYTAISGTLNFAQGEQIKSILVPILSDNKKSEANETFLVVLSSPVNLTITDGSATGTILIANQPGTILISELRTSGPAGAGDDFVEIYNNSDSPHTVNDGSGINDAAHGYGLYKMGTDCNATPILIGVIPNGTVISGRGHYLFVGSAYSLSNYGGTGASAGDQLLSQDIEDDRNVAIFSTTQLANLSPLTRLDAVGFGSNIGGGVCDLLREGTTLPPQSGSVLEYSYFRDECGKDGNPSSFGNCPTNGMVQDLNNNSIDFIYGNTTGTMTPAGQLLAAPGPQNLGNPRLNLSIGALLLDNTKGSTADPNRVRDNTPVTNGAAGTLSIRRRIVNSTGAPVTRLRFRIVDFSVFPVSGATADLRALSSSNITVNGIKDSATCAATGTPSSQPCTVTVFGTALETPPAQSLGGGLNSSYNAGTITLPTPLAPGQSINLQFLLGVQKTGSFKFFFNVEALP